MSETKRIKTALVSVYHKEGLDEIITKLHEEGVEFLSTGGTRQFIESLGYPCKAVEDLTTYPSILGGRVKTLHPKIFGGILCRRGLEQDMQQIEKYEIPEIDLVIVDLYPFEATVASGAEEPAIIEKIDIGGISLIRAAAKNYNDVVIVASQAQYQPLRDMLMEHGATTSLEERRWFAKEAFAVSSHYDSAIFNYFDGEAGSAFRQSANNQKTLRYGENPHQKGYFYGNIDAMFDQIHGKEISYNNLLDINAAVDLIDEFTDTTFAILKHNNACGLASRPTVLEAWNDALAGDPVSAFGGVLITNAVIDKAAAEEINKIFFEVIIAMIMMGITMLIANFIYVYGVGIVPAASKVPVDIITKRNQEKYKTPGTEGHGVPTTCFISGLIGGLFGGFGGGLVYYAIDAAVQKSTYFTDPAISIGLAAILGVGVFFINAVIASYNIGGTIEGMHDPKFKRIGRGALSCAIASIVVGVFCVLLTGGI